MAKKSEKSSVENPNQATLDEKADQTWALANLSRSLLKTNTLEDVLRASLEVIVPTDVAGVTILLCGGPSDDRYLEIAAAWEQDGRPTLPIGTRFHAHDCLPERLLAAGRSLVIQDLSTDERICRPLRSALLQAQKRAVVALPLQSGQDYFGLILIDRVEAKPFSHASIHIYETMTALTMSTIQKLQSIQETRRALAETSALYEISRRLSEAQNINNILLTVLDSELFGAAGGTIALLEPPAPASPPDSTHQELVFWAAAGASAKDILGKRMPVSQGIIGWVVRENQPAFVPDAYADDRFYPQMDTDLEFRTQSILCAPLQVEGQVIGAIELVDVRQEYLSEEGLRLLGQVAQQVPLFIERQRLLTETQRHAQDLERLLDIGRDLAATLDREEALQLITSHALDLVEGDGCHVFLLQPNQEILMPVASNHRYADKVLNTPLKVGAGVTGRVALTGVGEIVNRVDLDPHAFQVPGTPREPESLISAPLISEGEVIGVMTVSRLGEEEFIDADLQKISALSGHAATVLANARLFKEAQQRSEELTALNAVVSTASQSLSLEEILDATLERVTQVTPGSAAIICLCDSATGETQLITHRNLPPALAQSFRDKGMRGTLCEVTASKGQTFAVPDLTQDTTVDATGLINSGLRAYLGTPLIAYGQVMGALSILSSEPNAFTPTDVSLLTAIGHQVGISVRNARLYKQTQHALEESTVLYETSQAIANSPDLADVLQVTVNRMAEHVGADQCRLVLFDEALGYGVVKAEYHPTPGIENVRIHMADNPSYEVLRDTGQPVAIDDVSSHPVTAEVSEMLTGYGIKSTLLVPLMVRGRLIGSIGLDTTQDYRIFTESEINFCRTLADRAALTVENRRLFAQTQATLQETITLYRASRSLNQAQDLEEILHAVTDNLPIKEIDQCLIASVEPDSDPSNRSVEIKAMWDHEGDYHLLGMRFTPQEFPGSTAEGTVETFVINNLEGETRFDHQSVATLEAIGVKSALIIPLKAGETLLGWLLLITHHQTHLFDPDQIRPYEALADQAAVVIRNQQLLQQVQASLKEVETVHRQYLHDEWVNFLQSQEDKVTGFTYDQGALVPAQDLWMPSIGEAVSQGAIVTQAGGGATDNASTMHKHSEAEDKELAQAGSNLIAPLKVGGQIIGALGLEDPEQARDWTADELSMVEEIADQVALAIENARLLDQTQTSLAETARLYQATGQLSGARGADEVIKVLAAEVQTALGPFFSGAIWRAGPDPAGSITWMEVSARWNPAERDLPLGTRFNSRDHPMLNRYVGRKEFNVNKYSEIPSEDKLTRMMMDQSGMRAMIFIPLVAGESWLGLIFIASQQERTPDERTLRFLQSLADRAAVALESERLYEETQRRAVQLEAASKVSRAATSILDQDELLSTVVGLIRDNFNYYHAQIFLLDPTGNWAALKASTGEVGQKLLRRGHALEVGGPSLIGYVTGTGQPRIVHDVREDPLHFENDLLPDTRSELAIPIKVGEQVIGALDVQSTEPAALGREDVTVLSTLTDQLATAIENARLYQEQLETAEKLREVDRLKSQFMANMSHELRTPLNSIIGFSRVILKGIDGPLTDLQEQDLTAIYNSGTHLLELINNILDLSKIEAGKMELAFEEIDLSDIIEGVISTAVALIKDKPKVKLRHSIAPDLPLIIADATRIRQVLLNLISNAIKFTKEGYIKLNATHDARFVTIKVTDSGAGIPADKFDVLFQEFEQVDGSSTRTVGGTGLGLPITRHFVELHDGRIWVESEIGVGSTFAVQLPIKGPQAGEEVLERPILDPNQRLILVIDDDVDVIKLYKRYLEKQDYQVVGLSDSTEAITKVRALRPFAILLDVLMPEKDGWTVIQELKSDPQTQDIPVIMCSIVSEAGHGFSLGAADYLVKPIPEDRLLAALIRLANGSSPSSDESQKVLIIDDTPEDRHLLRRMLESADERYQVIEASGGVEGLEIIQQQQPNLVVLDLIMPEMDGFAVLEMLKSTKAMRQIPIIIVTAKELSDQESKQINGQVAALFQKGLFKENELLQDVDQVLRRMRKNAQKTETVEE